MTKIFEAKVLAVGPEALSMIKDANMLILFGEEAPQDLADYCYKIDNKNLNKGTCFKLNREFCLYMKCSR